MATFTMTHDIDCDSERFWKLFFDRDFNHALFKALEFREWNLVEQTEDEKGGVLRRVQAIPKMDLPGPLAKLLGSNFGYSEEGRFDPEAKKFRFVIKASTMAEKLRNEGTVRCEDAGPGKCRRIVDVIAEAKVFGVSGLIESTFEKDYRVGWAASADFTNKWLKNHP